MSGYKRVNFYELCRLCATNQQKDKTHIFEEEGRKIQLQNKIQSCLSLTVCENDYLPKVVCSKCLRTLEVCYSFRQECVTSESMLSSYFKNFRYTEDFKKSGKVYIKDTSTKPLTPQAPPPLVQEPPPPPVTSVINSTATFAAAINDVKPLENIPFYTLQLPAIVTNQPLDNKIMKTPTNDLNPAPKIIQNQPTAGYNLNITTPAIKAPKKIANHETLSNVVVNANGEVINIAQLVDFESMIINQAGLQNLQKIKFNQSVNNQKGVINGKKIVNVKGDEQIIKIDITNSEIDNNNLPHIKNNSSHNNNNNSNNNNNNNNSATSKNLVYALKVDDQTHNKNNQSVIFNNLSQQDFNNQISFNYATSQQTNANLYQQAANMINNDQASSTVNLNVLNQDFRASNSNFAPAQAKTCADESPVNPPAVKQHTCDICQKSFKRREHLYQHVKLHTGFRPYTCENCHKSFMRKEHLLRHMTSHSGQKNFTCNICDKSFSRNDNLLKHKKTHDKQASYTCDVCQKQFVMKHYYLAHKLTHDSESRCGLGGVWNVLKA